MKLMVLKSVHGLWSSTAATFFRGLSYVLQVQFRSEDLCVEKSVRKIKYIVKCQTSHESTRKREGVRDLILLYQVKVGGFIGRERSLGSG